MASAKDLGERKIIELILECLDHMPDNPVPFGDDVSAVEIGHDKLAVIKADMLVGKTDVPRTMSLWQAARKAVIMNISDLAAKGAQPLALLASIGVPQDLKETDIQQIGKGLNAGAREYNAYILGGDTNEASDLVISCMALGICNKGHLIKRSGAKRGDYVAATGAFGKTAIGLKILMENLSAQEIRGELVNSVLMPKARVKEGMALAQSKAATASVDSSDGLAWSLHEISRASNVGFLIDKLPIAPETEKFAKIHNLNPVELALYGGEEYELLVTIKPDFWQEATRAVEKVGGTLIRIGVVTEEKQLLLKSDGKTIFIDARGWEHFKTD
ncbi:MAG: thiamine-phosphate kinase [Candidatus Bathyarchaeum sp.]|nr:MAG: thiamine-phosphate kinase [Candidatus Bathyarchaeum sp.]